MGDHSRRHGPYFIPGWEAGGRVVLKGLRVRSNYHILLVVVLISLLGQSCITADKATKIGRNSVEQFRSQWRDRKYKEIYVNSDQAFRERVSEKDFIAFGNSMHAQLGDIERSKLIEERVDYSEAGTMVILRYQTKFAGGEASEQLAWILKGGKSHLYNYAININVPVGEDNPLGVNDTLAH